MKYAERVEHNLRGLTAVSTGACPGCDTCREAEPAYVPREEYADDYDGEAECWRFAARPDAVYADEDTAIAAARAAYADDWGSADFSGSAGFSWIECGICGSRLGGDREVWHGIDAHGRIQHFDDACVDCVGYLGNGDLHENAADDGDDD